MIFAGLRVIDCSSYIAAPCAATVLSDFGADVIKVEPPVTGDAGRRVSRLPGNPKADVDYGWVLDNRNKRGIAIDLARYDGQAVLHRLVSQADVFITNYTRAVRTKLNLDYEKLSQLNERLVYGSFTGYGERGAEAAKPGFDHTAYWARSGLMDGCRPDAASTPARAMTGMGDHPSAMSLFGAVMIGLYQRERTGRGSQVSSSLIANGFWANGFNVQAALCDAVFFPRPPREQLFNALASYYRCRDGKWLILTILNEDRQWPALAKCLGRESLIVDPRFSSRSDRFQNSNELIAELDKAFAARDGAEWSQILASAGLVFEMVASSQEAAADQQAIDAGVLVAFEDSTLMTVDSPLSVEGAVKVKPRKAPDVGQHTDEILREYGYGADEIVALRATQIVK